MNVVRNPALSSETLVSRQRRETSSAGTGTFSASRAFEFGAFTLHPERQLLLNGDVPLRIGGRAFDILLALVERAGELVRKEDLLASAWPGLFVDESNLKVNMASLRRLLGEDIANPNFIATVIGRGYRFVAPVRRSGQAPHQPKSRPFPAFAAFAWPATSSGYRVSFA